MNIAIIDYGMGNLRSVAKALEAVAPEARIEITQSKQIIESAERIVLPGQGAIRGCMQELQQLDLIDSLRKAAATRPFLGLCLGPQVLLDFSEENDGIECLGILPGRVLGFREHLDSLDGLKIPHMGWNTVQQTREHPLWRQIPQNSRFYFVHSYYPVPASPDLIAGETEYGLRFAAAIARDNIFAVQFHPEKSAADGLRLLSNFTRWNP